ncbi:hypothetical protein NCCP2716_17930 [Sporosarcina sp. NCCP-2716]|uniref:YsnF/AvaK domain-containing protein n=1 Tax=Sporosarcina sp. NCCP-2716 TaxID=2943679 RepID=UPI00203EDFA5|nr:YsnF/AvaK domain-containing protein [Sporosarcina sp. NCCP-2716]GKV69295.1 hypothetical protein NCCP2716_17930 [Sporosarcina sp. NCCP-2716]
MNEDKRFVGTYHTEDELYAKIKELKASGTPDDNIYVIAKDDRDVQMVRSRTDAEVKTTDGNWMDKFMNFMSGENHVHHMLGDLGLSEAEKERYTRELENGGMVLYVDEGEAGELHRKNTGRYGTSAGVAGGVTGTDAASDPNLGANIFAPGETADAMPPETTPLSDPSLSDTAAGGFGTDTGSANHLHGDYDKTAGAGTGDVRTERLHGEGAYNKTTESMPETVDLHEEKLEFDKQRVQTGEVELEKNVVEERVKTDIPVEHEEVTIERRPVTDQTARTGGVSAADGVTFDEETIRVPVTEERVEVTKRPVVTEELVINKKTVTDTERVDETLKREEVEVNRTGETDSVDVRDSLDGKRTDKTDGKW